MVNLRAHELGSYLREQRQHARLSLRQLAEVAEISNPYLSQIERGLKKPSAEILQSLAKGLRISAESLYVRAGILDEREDRMELESAILADPSLTERQRRVLLDIYESFRAENARQEAAGSPADTPPPAEQGPAVAPGPSTRRTTRKSARITTEPATPAKSAAKKATTTKRAATKRTAAKTSRKSASTAPRKSAVTTKARPEPTTNPAASDAQRPLEGPA